MFSLDVVDTDRFLEMPVTTQALYFHLGMRADDDGFVSSPKKITTLVGCNEDDLKLLIAKQFVIPFESGVVVISEWNINNWVRPDRKHETRFIEEKKMLSIHDDIYVLVEGTQPNDNQMTTERHTEVRLGKDSIGKDRIDYQLIADMYNDTCVSYPKLTKLSDKRKKAIKARLKVYTVEDFKRLFEMAEASSFLKGQNKRNWSATFDWLIADGNMAKILDGNYADNISSPQTESQNFELPDYYQNLGKNPTPEDAPFQ